MKKKSEDKGLRKLQLHRETLQTLLVVTGGEPSVTCYTCPDLTGSAPCGGCPASS